MTVSACHRQCSSLNELHKKGRAFVTPSAAMHAWQIFELHERLSEVACFSLLQEILGNMMVKAKILREGKGSGGSRKNKLPRSHSSSRVQQKN